MIQLVDQREKPCALCLMTIEQEPPHFLQAVECKPQESLLPARDREFSEQYHAGKMITFSMAATQREFRPIRGLFGARPRFTS